MQLVSASVARMKMHTRDKSVKLNAGQGGNDLLGNRKQTGDQKLVAGNLALVSALPQLIFDPLSACSQLAL